MKFRYRVGPVAALAAGLFWSALASAQAPLPEAAQPTALGSTRALVPPVQRSFATPEDAARALLDAMHNRDGANLHAVLGPGSGKLIGSGDPLQDTEMRDGFVAAYGKAVKFDRQDPGKAVLLLGDNEYPFPYPLVKDASGWKFDAKSGAEEILNRRIGRNELAAMQVCLAYVDAQREYATKDFDHHGLLEYAKKLISTPGTQDGLYWDTKEGDPPSPLGPLVARAEKEGYGDIDAYHGYEYKILTGQGKDAPGGAYDYIVKGKMIGGFALVAYPARWNASGVMTFMCNHEGVVYEKNLGRNTRIMASTMLRFNPDASWQKAQP